MNDKQSLLITGASSGVGRSLANFFKGRYHLVLGARRISRLNKYFGNRNDISIYKLDLSEEESVKLFCNNVLNEHGNISNLINNAGVNIRGRLENISISEIKYSLKVNSLGPLYLMNYFLEGMRNENYGRIINVTSGAPLNCFPEFGAYSASKSFLNAVTVTAAKEHSNFNIKINLMSPGPVRSEMSPNSDLDPEVCHPMTNYLLNLDESGSTGRFFWLKYEVPLFPDLEGVKWIEGKGNDKLKEIKL